MAIRRVQGPGQGSDGIQVERILQRVGFMLSHDEVRVSDRNFKFGVLASNGDVRVVPDVLRAAIIPGYDAATLAGKYDSNTRQFKIEGITEGGVIVEPSGNLSVLKPLIGKSGRVPEREISEDAMPQTVQFDPIAMVSSLIKPMSDTEIKAEHYNSALNMSIGPTEGRIGFKAILGEGYKTLEPLAGRTVREVLDEVFRSPGKITPKQTEQALALYEFGKGIRDKAAHDIRGNNRSVERQDRMGRAIQVRASAVLIAKGMMPEDERLNLPRDAVIDGFVMDLGKPYVPEDQKKVIRAALDVLERL